VARDPPHVLDDPPNLGIVAVMEHSDTKGRIEPLIGQGKPGGVS
jgi:hypothetical protein